MDRFIHLLISSLILFTSEVSTSSQTNACTPFELNAGLCTVGGSLGDGGATLEGSAGYPGTGSGNAGGTGTGSGGDPSDPTICDGRDFCFTITPPPAAVEPITLADVAHFHPRPPVDVMEPDGWMVVGLDTNFFASSHTHVVDGVLLGQPAAVRFTPVAWHWDYGDGSTHSTTTPGGSWSSLGLGEFDKTPNSHIYRASGTYYIDLTVDFTAEYRFAGGSWVPIAGTLPIPANRLLATAGNAKTVLVEHDCIANPAGPGC